MKAYKVVRYSSVDTLELFLSATIKGWLLEQEYGIGKTTYARKWLLELGYGLCVFREHKHAVDFMYELCEGLFSYYSVYECEAKKLWKPKVKMLGLYFNNEDKDVFLDWYRQSIVPDVKNNFSPFPKGTWMTDQLTLTRRC